MLSKFCNYAVLALPLILILAITIFVTGFAALWDTLLALIPLFVFIGSFLVMGFRYRRVAGKPINFRRDGVASFLLLVLSFWPVYAYIPLYFMAVEAQKIIGHWPEPMVNDPKWMKGAKYDYWSDTVDSTFGLAFVCLTWFFPFFVLEWKRMKWQFRLVVLATFLSSLAISLYDPGVLFTWWID